MKITMKENKTASNVVWTSTKEKKKMHAYKNMLKIVRFCDMFTQQLNP